MKTFEPGMRVRLSNNVLHKELRGLCGVVEKTVKSRGVVVVRCDGGERYDAFPENVEPLNEEVS